MRRKPLILSKIVSIRLPQPSEELFETPIDVPTSMPSTPQFSRLLSDNDLARADIGDYNYIRIFRYNIVIRNPTTSTVYVIFVLRKNERTIYSGFSYSYAGYYSTFMVNFFDVKPGDRIEVFFYATQPGLQWIWHGWCSTLTRLKVFPRKTLQYFRYEAVLYPDFSLGNPRTQDQPLGIAHDFIGYAWKISTTAEVYGWREHKTYGLYLVYTGDQLAPNSVWNTQDRTYYPSYYRDVVPIKVIVRAYRE